ncbi:SsgA family sporulation/cell division regulator [Nocardioides nematodiphilus]|uniref:SsgA family sporulation/cell division regulator n=1 Tax=Nocardioides nematodiphilus TaxID=2849669 RepID=UPI001CDA3331|nr:SsgA family sporulation/cell division regulator [Nocardioides nematodiphilus]MCA1982696.1 SsgA family sporulation/cell division regulator [Nocardioides nematodiphilus]
MNQQPTTPVLSQDITLACVDPWGRNVDVPTTLGYRKHDPYAVTLTFHSSAGDVEWIVARTLLLQGLASPTGEGDVKVYPSIDDDASVVAVLDFSSPDGRLVAQANTHELQAFLARTFAAVPVGTESEHLDLDALISDLLNDAV